MSAASEITPADAQRALREQIKSSLRAGQVATARHLLDSAPPRWRNTLRYLQLEARILLDEDDSAEACELCRYMMEPPRANADSAVIFIEALRRQGQLAEAREVFLDHVWSAEVPLQRKFRLLSALASAGPADEIELFLDRVDAAQVADAGQMLAPLEDVVGLPHRALARLLAFPVAELKSANKGLLVKLLNKFGRRDEAIAQLKVFLQAEPDDPSWVVQLCEIQASLGETSVAAMMLDEASRRWPNDWRVLKLIGSMALPLEERQRMFGRSSAARETLPFMAFALLQFALLALTLRHTEAAIKALEEPLLEGRGAYGSNLLAALRSRPLDAWTAGMRFPVGGTQKLECVTVSGAQATIVVFPGLDDRCHFLPIEYLDSLLAEHPVNVIYVRESSKRVLNDAFEDFSRTPLLAALRECVAHAGAVRLVTMGFSLGGFSAMRCAAVLEADAAVSFTGQTWYSSPTDESAFTSGRLAGRGSMVSIPLRQRDVLPDIEARPGLRVWQFPGSEHAEDMRQAARISHLPQVTTEPCRGVRGHLTLLHLVTNGMFGSILSRIIAGG